MSNKIENSALSFLQSLKEEKHDLVLKIILLTPQLAEIFKENAAPFRDINPRNLQYLCDEIRSKNFMLTGEALIFGWDGKMMDGSHRCDAVIETGESTLVLIVGGIDPEYIHLLGEGLCRTLKDYFTAHKIEFGKELSTITRRCYIMDNNLWVTKTPKIANRELVKYFQKEEALLVKCFATCKGWYTTGVEILPLTLLTSFYIETLKSDKKVLGKRTAETFIPNLLSGNDLHPGDPVNT